MLSLILLLALASAVLCQDLYTFTTNVTESGDEVTVTVNVTQAVDAFNAGLTLSGASFNGNVSDAATRLVRYDGCTSTQTNQIYAGWQDSWQLMDATAEN